MNTLQEMAIGLLKFSVVYIGFLLIQSTIEFFRFLAIEIKKLRGLSAFQYVRQQDLEQLHWWDKIFVLGFCIHCPDGSVFLVYDYSSVHAFELHRRKINVELLEIVREDGSSVKEASVVLAFVMNFRKKLVVLRKPFWYLGRVYRIEKA